MRSSETKRLAHLFLSPHQFGDHVHGTSTLKISLFGPPYVLSFAAKFERPTLFAKYRYYNLLFDSDMSFYVSRADLADTSHSAVLLVRVPPLRVGAHLMASSPAAHRPWLILWFTLFRDAGTCVNFMPFVLLLCLGLSLFFLYCVQVCPFIMSR